MRSKEDRGTYCPVHGQSGRRYPSTGSMHRTPLGKSFEVSSWNPCHSSDYECIGLASSSHLKLEIKIERVVGALPARHVHVCTTVLRYCRERYIMCRNNANCFPFRERAYDRICRDPAVWRVGPGKNFVKQEYDRMRFCGAKRITNPFHLR